MLTMASCCMTQEELQLKEVTLIIHNNKQRYVVPAKLDPDKGKASDEAIRKNN